MMIMVAWCALAKSAMRRPALPCPLTTRSRWPAAGNASRVDPVDVVSDEVAGCVERFEVEGQLFDDVGF